MLGVDELHMYDLFTPLVKEVKMEVTYDEAKKTMVESFAPLGKEYQDIVQKGLDSRWVDVLENKGKRSGAYSSGTFGTNPYVLMNWQNNVNNLYTLAHEFGHSDAQLLFTCKPAIPICRLLDFRCRSSVNM